MVRLGEYFEMDVLKEENYCLSDIERFWLREALFNGMTANAFKLGTTLSLGWFWLRIAGCSALYGIKKRDAR